MSADEGEEDLGSMAWPGFVDILSSVIIMFVFFVMVVASALYFHIIIFKSKILSEVSESVSASSEEKDLATTNRSLTKKIEELEEKVKLLEKPETENDIQLYQVHTQFSESEDQQINIREDSNSIIIYFGYDSISITEENNTKIKKFITSFANRESPSNTKVKIISHADPNALNDVLSKKLAVSRMLNARNLFLETKFKMENVKPSVSSGADENGEYNWVEIRMEPQ